MKKYLAAAFVFTATQFGQVQAQEAPPPAPIEAFYCNFHDGKSMKDLEPVATRLNNWAVENDPTYSAWILTPVFGIGKQLPQVVWLGSNPSGNAFGKGLSAWLSTGRDIQTAFDAVIDCGMGHFLASSVEINAPEGIPGDGAVMFSQCKLENGANPVKAIEAHRALSRDMRSLGARNSNWAFFPMLGGGDIDFDYWGVSTFKSWQDYFDAYEIYVNGGGQQKFAQHLGGISNCNDPTPTVWNVKLVRKGSGQR